MQITDRDFEIINFVLAMKFSSIQSIHQKFFKRKKDGSTSDNEWYARERLRQLIEMGYISTVRYRFEQKNYYIATKHGYDLIYYMLPTATPAKPIQQIDVRTFDHDIQLMKSRLLIEEFENVTSWQSDRQLKCQYPDYFEARGSRDAAPDGVYNSASGKVIAFEYEIAQKSKKRYLDKIHKYVSCIRNKTKLDGPRYDLVRFVCEKECVYKTLVEMTSIYNQYFAIERSQDFFDQHRVRAADHNQVLRCEQLLQMQ